MRTFTKWVEDNKLDLPQLTDSEEAKDATAENNIRTGIKFGYPDAYAMHYPPAYYAGRSATAYLDLQQRKQQRSVKGGPNTAAN